MRWGEKICGTGEREEGGFSIYSPLFKPSPFTPFNPQGQALIDWHCFGCLVIIGILLNLCKVFNFICFFWHLECPIGSYSIAVTFLSPPQSIFIGIIR